MPQWSVGSWDFQLQVQKLRKKPLRTIILHSIILYILGAQAVLRAGFGQGTGNIWLDQVACTGTETTLAACLANPIGIHDCSHFEDAGVRCQTGVTTPTPGRIFFFFHFLVV